MQSLTRPGATGLNLKDLEMIDLTNLTPGQLSSLVGKHGLPDTYGGLLALRNQQRDQAAKAAPARAAAAQQAAEEARVTNIKDVLSTGNIPTPVGDQAIVLLEKSLTPTGRTELDLFDQLVDEREVVQDPFNVKLGARLGKDPGVVARMGAEALKREATFSAYSGYLIIHKVSPTLTNAARWLKANMFHDWPLAFLAKRKGKKEKLRKK